MSTKTIVNNGRVRALPGLQVSDEPGHFEMIDKFKLQIDPSYQRGQKNAKQRKMAAEWSWSLCGALIVGRRAGKYSVIDGQQRLGAANRREDIRELPCMIFEMLKVEEEAGAFLGINTRRTAVLAYESFQARLTKGEPIAMAVNEMLQEHQYTVSGSAGHNKGRFIFCVARLLQEMEQDAEVLKLIFPIAIRITGGGFIDQRLLGGLCFIERGLSGSSRSITHNRYLDNLTRAGRVKIDQEMATMVAAHGQHARSWAAGIIKVANIKLHHSNKIPDLAETQ